MWNQRRCNFCSDSLIWSVFFLHVILLRDFLPASLSISWNSCAFFSRGVVYVRTIFYYSTAYLNEINQIKHFFSAPKAYKYIFGRFFLSLRCRCCVHGCLVDLCVCCIEINDVDVEQSAHNQRLQ